MKKKSNIGNTYSNKENRMPTERLRMELSQNPEKIKKIVIALIDKAIDGDLSAIKEVFDRVDGKVVNQVNAEISDNRPIYVVTGIDNDDNGREDNAVLVDTGFRDTD
jgi:hypothetical protein|tara:strand:+ start:299 stop:619 length:321 start_codon:yes stop_codon:yes gene_type:complete